MKRSLSVCCLFLVPAVCLAQPPAPPSVVRPLQVSGYMTVAEYKLVRLSADNVPAEAAVIWDLYPEESLDIDERGQSLIFTGPPGEYKYKLRSIVGKSVQTVRGTVKIERTVTPEPQPPGPTPPGPQPPGPNPPGPTPTPTPSTDPIGAGGFAVLMSFDQANTTRPAAQQSVLQGRAVRDYLQAKCIADPTVPNWKAFRIWPENTTGGPKLWVDALAKTGGKDWILIGTGSSGYSGPLPKTEAEAMALLKRFGGE